MNVIKWNTMETIPTDGRFLILWHSLHKASIVCRRDCRDISKAYWIEKTATTIWPEEAFTHWSEELKSPEVPYES